MNKQEILATLANALTNNLGNKLTLELANGLVFALDQAIPNDPAPEKADELTPAG